MAVTVLETMSREDLATYRELAGMDQAIQNMTDRDAMSPQEVRDFYVNFWGWIDDCLRRYGIEGDEAEEAKFSVFTGQIYIGSEE